MKRSGTVWALVVALGLNVVVAILLTPLGFESRPTTALTGVGVVAIGTVFAGLVLDIAALVMLFRRVRFGAILAMVGSILFVFPNVVDRLGSFFRMPIPGAINALEYVFMALIVVTLVLAIAVYPGEHRICGLRQRYPDEAAGITTRSATAS